MRIGISPAGCLLAGLVLTSGAAAHHSAAVLYDMDQQVTMEGVVTKYELGNPHMRIYFDRSSEGRTEEWMAEGGSRTVLLRKGWDGTEVAPGDVIRIRGNPSRDGSKIVHVEYLILPDGTELYAEDLDSSLLEQRRQRRD